MDMSNAPKPTLVLSADVPDEAIDLITCTRDYGPDDVPFFRSEAKATEFPCLVLRASESPGLPGHWTIVDRLTEAHRIALGREGRRVREGTGCVEDDRDGAVAKFLDYSRQKRVRILARTEPKHVPIAAILTTYADYLVSGAHDLAAATVKLNLRVLAPIAEYFGCEVIGAITPKRLKAYEKWRRRQKVKNRATFVSATQVGGEIATLRRAVNHFQIASPMPVMMRWWLPRRDTPPVVWWTRDEAAAYLWACRGRIRVAMLDENAKFCGWRWKIARDDDPSLVGPEGDRRMLRSPEEIERRKPEARRVLLAIYTASRARVLIDAGNRAGTKAAYISRLEGGVFRRKPIGAPDSNKRRPAIPIVDKLGRFVDNWAWRDAEPREGRRLPSTILHKPDGDPCSVTYLVGLRAAVWADAGVDKPMNFNVLRHTAAMWMKIEGVSAWVAANFLGCRQEGLTERYGIWDMHSLYAATDALTRGTKQKEAARRAASQGLSLAA